MQERCKNLIKAISRQKELGVGKDYIRSLQTCISYINQRLEVCELGSEEEDYLKKCLQTSMKDLIVANQAVETVRAKFGDKVIEWVFRKLPFAGSFGDCLGYG